MSSGLAILAAVVSFATSATITMVLHVRDNRRRKREEELMSERTNKLIAAQYIGSDNWEERGPDGEHFRNGHFLILAETDWRCQFCGHMFDAAKDANLFVCGEDCTGKHPGDAKEGAVE